jgi:Na+/H+ antiporter NhaC|tara:strand:- start:9763 stop:11376 length:1614 start_codon:yes stop_codon:yes gene_type:complete
MFKDWKTALALVLFAATWGMLFFGGELAALWPSFLALAMVVLFRRVVIALLVGALSGAILLSNGNPALAFVSLVEIHFLPKFGSLWNVGALVFTLLLGGFAAILEKSGALDAWLGRVADQGSRRRLEGAAMGFGLICFFDGLANSLMVGRLFRGLADRCGVARERLAYIVDTTSAAVACIAFISTWIAFQLSQIREGMIEAGREGFADPYSVYFSSIPVNFYCWFALILLVVAIYRQWNIGPMKSAQAVAPSELEPLAQTTDGEESTVGRWRFFGPLALLIFSVIGGIVWDGFQRLGENGSELSGLKLLAAAFGASNAAIVMVWASIIGVVGALIVFPRSRGGISAGMEAFENGVLALFKPALILVAVWVLGSVIGELQAGDVLSALLEGAVSVKLLPAVVFVAASVISFTTGTSWGTMALVMPLSIPLFFGLGSEMDDAALRFGLSGIVAAVFSGAVFGDHCSPLSDTTIVSSIACGIEPHEHVKTQFPYALLAGGAALFLGFVPLFWLPIPGLVIVVGAALLFASSYIFATKRAT